MRRRLTTSRGPFASYADGAMARERRANRKGSSDREDGAILLLALAYLTAVALAVLMLSGWATNDLNNSSKFSSANSLTLAASDMMNVSIQYVRYNPLIPPSQPVGVASQRVACWGGQETKSIPFIDGQQVAVWCSTVWEPLSYQTRDVTFDACPIDVTAAACQGTNVLLAAEVIFDDYPPAPTSSAPIQDLCSTWCGSGITVLSWTWGSSAPISVGGVASTVSFSAEPTDTSVGASTTASVTVKDAAGNPDTGDLVSVAEESGPPGEISTVTAVTNNSGVATFTDIVPELVGNYTLIATVTDGSASATSSTFVVSTQKSVIRVTSTAPTNATENGTYLPSATASSGDLVDITVDPSASGVCVSSGPVTSPTVTFKAQGTCTLDFNDPGNASYAPATQVTQSFTVGGLTATQVGLTLSTNTPTASSTTNVTITITLENAVGVAVNSSGTTTLVLSDIGDGYFAANLGTSITSSSQTLNVSIKSGTSSATASFLDENTGPDTISAVNGTSNWGSASLTVVGGTPAQVTITPSTTSPTVSSVTSTPLTFQLEDAFGNNTTATSSLTLTVSDTNKGFFATANGVAGTSTLGVTFASSVGTVTAYYGNTTAGTDTITAKNGTTTWGSTTLKPVAGAASSVQITVSPGAPAQSATTNATVSVQLVDQYGNDVLTSGVSLTLSNSGNGFFATGSGTTGASTLPITTNASGVATGYFGDDVVKQSVTITVTGTGISVTTPAIVIQPPPPK